LTIPDSGPPVAPRARTASPRTLEAPAQFLAGWGAQNPENPEFANFPLAATFNPNAADTYDSVLTVIDNGGTVLATDSMTVTVAPEPSAVVLFGSLAFLAFRFGRRRRMA
jgi:hypothetical protein